MDKSKISRIKEKIVSSSFVKDVAVTTVGQIVVMLVAFGLNKIVSNAVTIEEFGIYNLIRRSAGVLTYVMLAAMGIAVPKYLAEYSEKKDKRSVALYTLMSLLIVVALSFIVGSVIMCFPGTAALLLFGEGNYGQYVLPMVLYAAASAICTYAYSYYRGIGDFRRYTTHQIIVQVLILVVAIIAGSNLMNVIMGWCFVYLVFSLIVLVPHIKDKIKDARGSSKTEVGGALVTLLKYGLPRVPGEFVLFAYSLLPLSVVLHKFGIEQSSFFSCAISITTIITPLFSFVGIVLLPMASKSVVNKDTESVNKGLKVLGLLYVVLSLCAIGFIGLCPTFVIKVLFSDAYLEAIPIVRIVAVSLLPNAIYLLLRNPLDGVSSTPYNTYSLLASFAVTLIMMWAASDIYACAWAYVAGYGVMGVLSFVFWRIALKRIMK